jgi:hypothetical protein
VYVFKGGLRLAHQKSEGRFSEGRQSIAYIQQYVLGMLRQRCEPWEDGLYRLYLRVQDGRGMVEEKK